MPDKPRFTVNLTIDRPDPMMYYDDVVRRGEGATDVSEDKKSPLPTVESAR